MSSSQASDPRSLLSTALAKTRLTTPHPLYQWKPLSDPSKQIRILTILPSIESNEIRCTLKDRPLIQDPPSLQGYRALSYVWGDPTDKLPLTIVDGDALFTVYVTRNLSAAITDLMKPANAGAENIATPPDGVYRFPNLGTAPLCLWVDAVCIDQSNDEERSAQVQIMGEIYARSCGALVWPGMSFVTGATIDILDNLLNKEGYWREYPFRSDLTNQHSWVDDLNNYFALKELFRLPWWSRVWVIQEVVL